MEGYAKPKSQGLRGWKRVPKPLRGLRLRGRCARPSARRGLKRPSACTSPPISRDGEIARLELLKAELETVFAELPANDDRFNLVLVPSRPARLWIDLFTYATVDDAGAYLFVRNSESGRRTLYSSTNIPDIADRITRYMAHEIVHRERMEASLAEPGRAAARTRFRTRAAPAWAW